METAAGSRSLQRLWSRAARRSGVIVACVAIVASCTTAAPTAAPTGASATPTTAPTNAPTGAPTSAPTDGSTAAPTSAPSDGSTAAPSDAPTTAPEAPTGDLVAAVDNLGTQEWAPWLAASENQITTHLIGEQLTMLDNDTGEVVPMLAESWELSDDGRVWTFHIRPNIPYIDTRFEAGRWGTVTAEDVKFTWESIVRDDSEFQQNGDAYMAAMGGSFDNFEILDELTFRLTADDPYVLLLTNMCGCADGNVIQSKRYFDEMGDEANLHPVGTGPWEFVSGTPGLEVNLKAVPNHWRSTPHFANLRLVEVPDDAARLVQVQSGAADIALLSPTLYNEAIQNDIRVINTPAAGNAHLILGGSYYGQDNLDTDAPWIQADAPEQGLAIREAMSLAIDRQLILDSVMFSQGEVTRFGLFDFPSDPALQDPSWTVPAYDLALAQQRLADGGYPDGFPVDFALFDQKFGTAGIGEAIAGMWEELGLEVNRMPTDEDAWDPRVDTQDTAGAVWIRVGGWFPETPLMLNTISPTREDAKFLYPPSDPIIAQMLAEPDREARNALARELGTMFIEDVPLISLYTLPFPWAIGPDVGDWTPNLHRDQISNLDTVTHP